MAIRIERSGPRTLVAQTRRPVRIAALAVLVLAVAGLVTALFDAREAEVARERDHARVRCQRPADRCEVARGPDRWVMQLDTLTGVMAETDGEGADARVIAAITRAHGLPTYHLCEARASDPEAAGIRAAADQLARFLADRRVESVDVACETRRRVTGGEGSVAGRIAAQLGGTLLILLAILLFAVDIHTEIDGQAGLVRIRGRALLPPRRWALERPTGEVAAVEVDTRGWGGKRTFTVLVRFKDDTTAVVLSPVSGWPHKVEGWTAALRKALGLAPNAP